MADPTDLAEAERKVRAFLAAHGDEAMETVLAEYDRMRSVEQLAGSVIKAEADAVRELEEELVSARSETDRARNDLGAMTEAASHLSKERDRMRRENGALHIEQDRLAAQRAAVLALLDHDTDLITAPQLAKIVRRALGETP